MFIHKVCSVLNDWKVPFAIVGGYAVVLHGFARGTVDIDLVLRCSLKHLQNAEAALKRIGLVSRIPITADDLFRFKEEYIQKRNLIAWNFYDPLNPLHQVDIIITYDLKNPDHVQKIRTAEGTVSVLAVEELIKMKKASGRPQDLEDVKALINLAKNQ